MVEQLWVSFVLTTMHYRVLHEEGRVEFDNRAVFAFAVCWLEERLATPLTK